MKAINKPITEKDIRVSYPYPLKSDIRYKSKMLMYESVLSALRGFKADVCENIQFNSNADYADFLEKFKKWFQFSEVFFRRKKLKGG